MYWPRRAITRNQVRIGSAHRDETEHALLCVRAPAVASFISYLVLNEEWFVSKSPIWSSNVISRHYTRRNIHLERSDVEHISAAYPCPYSCPIASILLPIQASMFSGEMVLGYLKDHALHASAKRYRLWKQWEFCRRLLPRAQLERMSCWVVPNRRPAPKTKFTAFDLSNALPQTVRLRTDEGDGLTPSHCSIHTYAIHMYFYLFWNHYLSEIRSLISWMRLGGTIIVTARSLAVVI